MTGHAGSDRAPDDWHAGDVAPALDSPAASSPAVSRTRLRWEIAIVLALSLGRSAVFSVIALLEALTRAPLGDQQTSINPGAAASEFWDVLQQFFATIFGLAPVALAIYFLWEPARTGFAKIGLTFERFGRNASRGLLLVLVIGIPGLALYAVGRQLGITVQVDASPLDSSWWTIPLLLLAALRAGLLEEVIMVGYLFDRLRLLGWSTWTIIISTAALRGAYHAYQGFGPLVGNLAMGVVFGWVYARWGRVMPLVVAHVVIDVVAFVGYPLAAAWWPGVFAPPA